MAYLGVPPQSGFISQEANQYFTGLTQNYIDLNQSISSLSSVIVLVNGVVQENSDLTLTSSTRITLGATLVSADKVTCIYVAKISSTQAPATGQVTNDMLAGSIANDKLAGSIANSKLSNSSITLNGSAVSLGGSATVGGSMTPSFEAILGTNQSVTQAAQTKVAVNTEIYDTDGCYDTSNYRFTPTTAGKYFVYGAINMTPSANNALLEAMTSFRFNGTRTRSSYFQSNTGTYDVAYNPFLTEVLTFNGSSDYVELWGRASGSSSVQRFTKEHEDGTYFGAFRILT